MIYTKPNFAMTETSLKLIQSGGTSKSTMVCRDSALNGPYSAGAYEVDE